MDIQHRQARRKQDAERIHTRADEARKLWRQGDHAYNQGDYRMALRLYIAAHHLVVDNPHLHRVAHQRLVQAHRELGMWVSWARDNALLITAPIGSFSLIGAVARAGNIFTRAQTTR